MVGLRYDYFESKEHIGSVFADQHKLLQALIKLHTPDGIELDPMFHKGNFYILGIPKPKYRFDMKPLTPETEQADAANLPLESGSISSMILDPPFVFGIHGHQDNNIMALEFGIFDTFTDLSYLYTDILKEAYRVLRKHGVLIFKCQDYTDSQTTLTHCYVHQWATELGFKTKDLAILHNKATLYNPNTTQKHLRKHHSYFMVFKK